MSSLARQRIVAQPRTGEVLANLFVLCQFDLGVAMVPVAEPELGNFDAELFMVALRRGAEMNVNLFEDWDFWSVVDQPLEALRARYGI